jgi:spore coat protein U-like protein
MKLKSAVLIFLLSVQGHAACFFTLRASSINFTVSEANPAPVASALTLSRGNTSDPKCDTYLIGFSEGGAASYNRTAINPVNGATIPYNLYKGINSTTMLRRIEDASSLSQVLNGVIARNTSVDETYYFKLGNLNSFSLTRGGLYKDTLNLTVDSGSGNNFTAESADILQVNINVPKMASLSLVNTGGSFDDSSTAKTLEFGEMKENDEMSFDVIVLSNAGYNLSVSSLNSQKMQLQGRAPTTNSQINYLFYANSKLKNISSSSPISIMTGSGVTPTQGTRVPFKVIIQSVTGKEPGIYQDYLTFTIATTE